MSEGEAAPDTDSRTEERLYTPAPDEAQLTARAVIVGCLVGSVVSCTNIYIGLKIGWSFGASIISAVLGFSAFAVAGKRLSVLETNVAQTAGSAAGYMSSAAGLLAAIPAMNLLGFEIPWHMLILYLGPSLFGAGFLIGPRVVLSLVLGAIVGWGILGPYAQFRGWAPGNVMDYKTGPRGWILWPGVALMVSEALTSVAMSWTWIRFSTSACHSCSLSCFVFTAGLACNSVPSRG